MYTSVLSLSQLKNLFTPSASARAPRESQRLSHPILVGKIKIERAACGCMYIYYIHGKLAVIEMPFLEDTKTNQNPPNGEKLPFAATSCDKGLLGQRKRQVLLQ